MTTYQQISGNKRKTVFLITIFVIVILALGYFGGIVVGGDPAYGISGLFYASVISIIMTSVSYFAGDSIALATAGAQQIKREDSEYVWNMVENLSITVGIPMPKIYIIQDPAINAFATGRNPEKASIAITTGAIQNLENEELEAVLAHEMSHIQNYDSRVMTIVVILVGVIALLSDYMLRMTFFGRAGRGGDNDKEGNQMQIILLIVGIVLIVLSPIIAQLIQLAVSRKREYLADASAVQMTRYAEGLIGALQKIAAQAPQDMAHANNATAHLYFSSPFRSGRALSKLFSTHPPIEDRIKALKSMGGIAE